MCSCSNGTSFFNSSGMEGEAVGSRPTRCMCNLGPVWFFFFFFSLITPHSVFVTHHSSLKISQFPLPHPFGHCFHFLSLKYFNLFVGPIPDHQVRPVPDHLKHPTNRRSSNLFSLYVFIKMVAASSLSSSSTASSSAWSPFAPMVSSKPPTRNGEKTILICIPKPSKNHVGFV